MNWQQIRKQWVFYLSHSLRDLMRNGTRTVFALFCIATGVAAVVALRSLALMIADELTTNLAEVNRGDIFIAASNDFDPDFYTDNTQNENVFTEAGIAALEDWAADQEVEIQFAASTNLLQLLPLGDDNNFQQPFSVVVILVEPEKWAYYAEIYSSEPSAIPLRDFFPAGTRNIVISERAARDNQLEVGDQVRIGGEEELFTVSALVADETEGSVLLRNGPAGLLGFAYYPLFRAEEVGLSPLPDAAYVKVPLGRSIDQVDESLRETFGENIPRTTISELEIQNAETADLINDLILVMGLSSVLIGGIGIVNTMQVIVGRRTLEIAVLKTLGLKAWRVTALFLTEAALMGLIGSLLGVLLGIALSYLVRGVGEDVLQTSLSWRPYPDAWFSGITLGMVITIAFGFLPTLIAGQVRPAAVLRPNDIQLPNAGLTRTLIALAVIIFLFGLTLNVIVAGRLQLPPTLMIGLGAAIAGLFGGIVLANQGVMQPIPDNADPVMIQRGNLVLSAALTGFLMIALFGINLVFEDTIPPLLVYIVPMVMGVTLYTLLQQIAPPHFAIRSAQATRQVLLVGGAVILGLLVGGGIFALTSTTFGILYPNENIADKLRIAGILCGVIGLVSTVTFRLRAQQAAGMIGLALIGGTVLGVIGLGIGELLRALLQNTPLWTGLEKFAVGIIVVEIITIALGAAYSVLWCLVWLMGRIPNFGNVDIKLALRNITTRKSRTASTMIGLLVGVAALSLITLTTSGVTSLLQDQIETNAGGNIVIITSDQAATEAVQKRLDSRIEGVKTYSRFEIYRGRIIAIDGEAPDLERFEFGDAAEGNRNEFGQVEGEPGIGFPFTTIDPRINSLDYEMKAGRFITVEDIDQPVMVLREPLPGSLLYELGIEVGTEITWQLRPDDNSDPIEVTFTVVGMIDRASEQAGGGDALQAPIGSVPAEISPASILTVADIEDEYVDAAMIEFAQIQNAFAIDTGFIVQLIERLIDQLLAIPTLVAILSLIAGIAIIANTVALDTQERRRQIGILKAVGLKGRRVLVQMMFENALIGLVAGLIGVGIGLLATILVGVLGNADQLSKTLELAPALGLVVLAVAVSLVATLISAWTAAVESPMNVLRYE